MGNACDSGEGTGTALDSDWQECGNQAEHPAHPWGEWACPGIADALAIVRLGIGHQDAAPLEVIEAYVAQALKEHGFVVRRVNIAWITAE